VTLRQLRDRLSLLQVCIAALAVLLGGGMQYASLAIAAGLTLWAFWRPLPEELSLRTQRLWTVGIFVALVGTLLRAFLRAEFLDAGVDFLLLLIVQRLFNRQRAREHLQLLMLGTLMMIVGAVVNTDLSYPLLLLAYLVISVMTLIVNHLMAEGERLGPRVHSELGRAAIRSRRTLWRAALGVAAMGAVGAFAVFLLFPRWGAGVFLRGAMARESQSGFSGVVQLGGFGRIKSDATVVARLEPLSFDVRPDRLHWHLRGSTFDAYENGRWSLSGDGIMTPLHRVGRYFALAPFGQKRLLRTNVMGRNAGTYEPRPIAGFAASQEMVRMQVILEDMGVDALFLASDPLAVHVEARGALERDRMQARGGYNLDVKIDKPQPGPVQYEFVSRLGEPTPEELRALGNPEDPPELAPYIVDAESLSDDAAELARRLTAGEATRYDKVMAIMDHLSTFEYTTDLEPSDMVEAGADPVDAFLFEMQEGHCEYFASALAVLLREIDVPTRLVNGYYGAHLNELGDFYAVRQADAHSWVEVYMGEPIGWVTFDPTPPHGRIAGDDAPLLPALAQALDAMRNAYLEYVIDYNLGKQRNLLENMGVRGENEYGMGRVQWWGVGGWGLAIGVAVGAGVLLRRRRRATDPPAVRIYGKLLVRLQRRGHVRGPSESPIRFARRLAQQGMRGADDFLRFAKLYEEHRFGPELPPAVLAELRTRAAAVRQALRRRA
jgi:hypothetical protein